MKIHEAYEDICTGRCPFGNESVSVCPTGAEERLLATSNHPLGQEHYVFLPVNTAGGLRRHKRRLGSKFFTLRYSLVGETSWTTNKSLSPSCLYNIVTVAICIKEFRFRKLTLEVSIMIAMTQSCNNPSHVGGVNAIGSDAISIRFQCMK